MVRGNPLLRAHVAEYRTLVFVISPHACFLSAAPVHRHRQTRYCTTFSAACESRALTNWPQVELPAGFPGLARVPLIIVAASAASATKTFSTAATAAARRIRLRLRLVDLQ